MPSRVIATIFALVSFTAALAVGFTAGNTPVTIMLRAMIVMVVCWAIGRVVGEIMQRVVHDHVADYIAEHPIPDQESYLAERQRQAALDAEMSADEISGDSTSQSNAAAAGIATRPSEAAGRSAPPAEAAATPNDRGGDGISTPSQSTDLTQPRDISSDPSRAGRREAA